MGRSPNLCTSVSSAQVPGVTLVSVTWCTSVNAFTGNQLCQVTKPDGIVAHTELCTRLVLPQIDQSWMEEGLREAYPLTEVLTDSGVAVGGGESLSSTMCLLPSPPGSSGQFQTRGHTASFGYTQWVTKPTRHESQKGSRVGRQGR